MATGSEKPEQRWYHVNKQALGPAKSAVTGNESFQRRAQQRSGVKQLDVDGLAKKILEVGDVNDLERKVEFILTHAIEAHHHWRAGGSGKPGRSLQLFATNLARFLGAYSGIVDVVRHAGGHYAEVAYGTLSLLFFVALNKSKNEERIANALADLRNSFPRIRLARDIYPVPRVEKLVAEVYQEVIIFARESVEYYINPRLRLRNAVLKPPELGVDCSIEKIRAVLAEINSEISMLLHEKAEKILLKNLELSLQIKRLEVELKSMREEAARERSKKDEENVENFKRYLGPISEMHTNIQTYKECLGQTFPKAVLRPESPRRWADKYWQMTPDRLDVEEHFLAWQQCSHSCILILRGVTLMEGRYGRTTSSWLSPAAVHITERLREAGNNVAFYTCHPGIWAEEQHTKEVISAVMCQILKWKPEILRHQLETFCSHVQKEEWKCQDADVSLQANFDLFVKLMKELHQGQEVYIVLDRVDKCRGRKYRLLKMFLRLVQNTSCLLKIVLVMDKTQGDKDLYECEEMMRSSKGFMVGSLDWDQQKNA